MKQVLNKEEIQEIYNESENRIMTELNLQKTYIERLNKAYLTANFWEEFLTIYAEAKEYLDLTVEMLEYYKISGFSAGYNLDSNGNIYKEVN